MGFRRGLTKKEKEWLAKIRTEFADPLYKRIFAKLVKSGYDFDTAAELAAERTVQAFEKLAEEAMSVDWYHFRRRVLFTDPDKAWEFLISVTSWLSKEEQAFISHAEEQLSLIFGYNRWRIPDNDADDAKQIVIAKLQEHILDPANLKALQDDEERLTIWLQACLSNVVGYESPHRYKNNFTSGAIGKTIKKNARETPLLTPEEADIYQGVTLDDTRLGQEEKAFREDDLSEQEERALQLLRQESPEIQTMLYLIFVLGYTYKEVCQKLGLSIKPNTLYKDLLRKRNEIRLLSSDPTLQKKKKKRKQPSQKTAKGGSPPDENG